MKNLWIPALIALCGFSCAPATGDGYVARAPGATFGAQNAPMAPDACAGFNASDCQGNPMQCVCSDREAFAFVDQNGDSPYHGQEVTPATFGKASIWGYYWAECGTCIQQIGYLQTLKDTLAKEGIEVEIVGVAYRGDVVGTLGQSPRPHSYACQGARRDLPSCRDTCPDPAQESCQIRIDSPMIATGRGGVTPDPDRGDWFIYRADGKLFEFIASEERPEQNGFLGNPVNWDFTKERLKAAALAPTLEREPCAVGSPCSNPREQWCQFADGACGGVGRCVTSPEQVCDGMTARQPVCDCDGFTYASRCDAEVDWASVSHNGACED